MRPQFLGRWTFTPLDSGHDLHDVWIDVREESIAVHVADSTTNHRFATDSAVSDWCLAMRATRIAIWNALPPSMPFKELVDPAWTSPLARVDVQLRREGLRWTAHHGHAQTERARSALHALLLSPRIMLHGAAILEHASLLWPVPVVPTGLSGNTDCATASRIVDVLAVAESHAVVLHVDLVDLTLTPAGGAPRQFATMLELLKEAIRLRKTVEQDPCIRPPVPPERDTSPPDIGEPWIAVPELGLVAQLPEYNGRYWACNWTDRTGEDQCSSGATPLLMVDWMLRRAESDIRMSE